MISHGIHDSKMLFTEAARLRDLGHNDRLTYSRKVFIPLTQLCRNVCHYCTFAQPPRKCKPPFMTPEEVLAVARAGAAAGCKEVLFTLGDKPERRYGVARDALYKLGHHTTVEYLASMAKLVMDETGLLPHVNPGIVTASEMAALRQVSVSQGLMLESASQRLCKKGGPHFGSPDKDPDVRLKALRVAGDLKIPMTTGILIGIGETREEIIESLLAIRALNDCYGHIQEIIVQNFCPKPNTRMSSAPATDPGLLRWAIASARMLFGPHMNIQTPPNLNPGREASLIEAGINDWGGVSPVTPDHVNPESPWPHIESLTRETEVAGKILVERLAVYPRFIQNANQWIDPCVRPLVLKYRDADGLARTDPWSPGCRAVPPALSAPRHNVHNDSSLSQLLAKAVNGVELVEKEIVHLFEARGPDVARICTTANQLRAEFVGDAVTYVVNRNINYTNICTFHCSFCAFSKRRKSDNGSDLAYRLDTDEIVRRVDEAVTRGATEVCLQGGIHPHFTGNTYLEICNAIRSAHPAVHIHGFSPLEVWHGAKTLGISVDEFLIRLRIAGLGSLPGTAAEILDDEVRALICPDKINTQQWEETVRSAHKIGLPTTSTIMFGHVDHPKHWARHLLLIRGIQRETGGITEFVPLPFVPFEAPLFLRGLARKGPTFRESVLMHAIARLILHPWIQNIQTSWVKMGPEGVRTCLQSGANDLGGTLMNESISRAAGAGHGQEMLPREMEALIVAMGRQPKRRTTLYGDPPVGATITLPLALLPQRRPDATITRKKVAARSSEVSGS